MRLKLTIGLKSNQFKKNAAKKLQSTINQNIKKYLQYVQGTE